MKGQAELDIDRLAAKRASGPAEVNNEWKAAKESKNNHARQRRENGTRRHFKSDRLEYERSGDWGGAEPKFKGKLQTIS